MPFLLYQGPDIGDLRASVWTVIGTPNANTVKSLLELVLDNHPTAKPEMFTISDEDLGEGPTKQFNCCVVELGRFAPNHVRFRSSNRT